MADDYPKALGAADAMMMMIEIVLRKPSDNPATDLALIATVVAEARQRIDELVRPADHRSIERQIIDKANR